MVKKLNLRSIGAENVGTTGLTFKSFVYEVVLLLSDKQKIGLQVTESSQLNDSGIDMLIGMDVITLGDFAISTYEGITCFSFRYPSQGLIDFEK